MDLAFFAKKADRRDSYNKSMLCNFSKGDDKKCAKKEKSIINGSVVLNWWDGTLTSTQLFQHSRLSVNTASVALCPTSEFQFLQSYHKVSLIKVAWCGLRVKNIYTWSPYDPWGPLDEEMPSYTHYTIRGGEAKLWRLKLASVSVPSSWVR